MILKTLPLRVSKSSINKLGDSNIPPSLPYKSSVPLSVCWDITSRCNDTCAFCYRVLDKSDLSLEDHRLILTKLINARVPKVSFIGGEPLLIKHLPILLAEARDANIITSIVTNGILLKNKWDKIVNYLNWVTLPIDGNNEQVQTLMTRRQGHLDSILSLVDMIKSANINIKINTVVGRHNIHDLHKIAKLVDKLKVQRWKIFQFSPIRGHAFQNAEKFMISDEEFNISTKKALAEISDKSNCIVTVADKDYLEQNYFTILQDGSVRVTANGQDNIVGSLINQEVQDIWQSPLFDHEKHNEHRKWLKKFKNNYK